MHVHTRPPLPPLSLSVIVGFVPDNETEDGMTNLTLEEGDTVDIHWKAGDWVWGCATSGSCAGQDGVFPLACVRAANSPSSGDDDDDDDGGADGGGEEEEVQQEAEEGAGSTAAVAVATAAVEEEEQEETLGAVDSTEDGAAAAADGAAGAAAQSTPAAAPPVEEPATETAPQGESLVDSTDTVTKARQKPEAAPAPSPADATPPQPAKASHSARQHRRVAATTAAVARTDAPARARRTRRLSRIDRVKHGALVRRPSITGLVPQSLLKHTNSSTGRKQLTHHRIDPVLRKWRLQVRQSLLKGDTDACYDLRNRISMVSEWRRQLMSDSTPPRTRKRLQQMVLQLVAASTQMQKGLTVPRTDDGSVANTGNTSVLSLYRMHKAMQRRLDEGVRIPTGGAEQVELQKSLQYAPAKSSDTRHSSHSGHGIIGATAAGGGGALDGSEDAHDDAIHMQVEVSSVGLASTLDEDVELHLCLWQASGEAYAIETAAGVMSAEPIENRGYSAPGRGAGRKRHSSVAEFVPIRHQASDLGRVVASAAAAKRRGPAGRRFARSGVSSGGSHEGGAGSAAGAGAGAGASAAIAAAAAAAAAVAGTTGGASAAAGARRMSTLSEDPTAPRFGLGDFVSEVWRLRLPRTGNGAGTTAALRSGGGGEGIITSHSTRSPADASGSSSVHVELHGAKVLLRGMYLHALGAGQLFLVCRAYRVGKLRMKVREGTHTHTLQNSVVAWLLSNLVVWSQHTSLLHFKSKPGAPVRRPIGCAVLRLPSSLW